jgi:hypothetical protein
LQHWPEPRTQPTTAGSSSNNSSSSSSGITTVRYGNVLLQQLPLVDVAYALPAVLGLAQTLSAGIAAVRPYTNRTLQQLVQQHSSEHTLPFMKMLRDSRIALAEPSVLALQLLLLASLAKLQHQQLAVTQQGLSAVPALTLQSLAQQQQQQQQEGQAAEQQQQQQKLHVDQQLPLPASHVILLNDCYGLKTVDITQLEQQHLPGITYITCDCPAAVEV